MRLIDADALLDVAKRKQSETEETAYNFLNCAQNPSTEWDFVEDMIENAPTIEPEVRHGRWIEDHTDLICSVCKWKYSDELPFMSNQGLDSMTEAFAHCPHCSARMDGGTDNG